MSNAGQLLTMRKLMTDTVTRRAVRTDVVVSGGILSTCCEIKNTRIFVWVFLCHSVFRNICSSFLPVIKDWP